MVRPGNVAAFRGSSPGLDARRGFAALLLLAALTPATTVAQRTPQPVFTELFAYDPAAPSQSLGKWLVSSQLDSKLQPLRVGVVEDPSGKTVGRVTVQVRLNPAHDASGRVDIWLNGAFCGAYQGPMADRDYGARRNGAPFVNAQPRFGIYRDWRAETQTIYFDKIMFWNADPAGHPDWSLSPPPG
jgi:hypothetical protein